MQATNRHKKIEEATPEVVVLPIVDTFAKKFISLLLAFSFGSARIEKFLRNSDYLTHPRLQLGDELELELTILIVISLNPRDQLDKSF